MRALADGTSAPAVDQRTGKPRVKMRPSGKRTGNIAIKVLNPWDAFHEPRIDDPDDHLWRVAKERRSKWELAALFPEHRAKILALQSGDDYSFEALFCGGAHGTSTAGDTDELTVRHFYHAPSPALERPAMTAGPQPEDDQPTNVSHGRYLCYVGDVALIDRTLDTLPVFLKKLLDLQTLSLLIKQERLPKQRCKFPK